ncbi:MAG: hypothetical protein A3C93_02805 [Candidatus Lloydbacteria bacterium RIFCSPHIGHO2_02_FULL_54_17]|uniref:Uncharacterized protein n=1 Tax=Candidatus Lloydbacteria bacterium RIFCSPHIGHO2_02_FULL_54_17 TaxID=1798664 RepID=A0A1G2DBE4_9BACT|nr:MAG: hypothetical protein A2762_06060 [Candidatus Lloydbacteria bacterium RIFCSPHIGHO2_01_FULL_54_11]OGZ10949.1 MAG: hypothetical protein A3C93_02805 [Candidatus Lloydbacteria bacterium RIFCSPHIGHO2_02_FULL_54_17]OGZ14929.1 MAG: hypothetical protein A2948_05400 [Candidatus Lloydbacteria bacterium RIFCSPLOWO2_01_FULL_54_18]OGZ17158.1 MAG: hypothetical protein A3H76_04060 [Candidatus Lloydbacteria bacterium RIFCSPLOWO2_02_FULL_54_12]
MDKFDTSFIPQQPLLKVEGSSRVKERVNLPLIIGFVFLFVSALVFGGLYFYEMSVERRIVALEKDLEEKEAMLNIADIDRYKKIDERLTLARQLLEEHIAFSSILALLEKITAEDIGFTTLSYAPSEGGAIKVSLHGLAPSYSAVYVQAEAWRGMKQLLKEVKMEMPVLNPDDGTVGFGASLTIDTGYTKYARTAREGGGAPSVETSTDTDAVTDEPQ